MRVVVFSDIHGNVVALEAVLAAIRRDAAPDLMIAAGDYALDGPRPAEAVALLRGLANTRFVVGNTDLDVLREDDEAAAFACARLSAQDLRWLESLPFAQTVEAAPGHSLLVVHANPRDLHEQIKPDHSPALIRPLLAGVGQEIVAFGHYHVPFVREIDRATLVNVASVGLPRDGCLRAVYVTLTFDGRDWQVAHHRIAFDAEAVAADYRAVDFPQAKKAAKKFLEAKY